MRLLFVARHFTYFRNFEAVVRLLAGRGHDVHLVAERDEALGGRDLVERLTAASPRITAGELPPRADQRWFAIATCIRRSLDFLTYASPLYAAAPKIRERAWERTPQLAVAAARWPGRRVIARALDAIDRAIPTDAALDAFLDEHRPDLVLLSPLIELGSPQLDVLKSARRRGTRTAVAVWSWDHLTSKARLRQQPDHVIVWNDTQRHEAEALHHVPRERIAVTGAQCFDHWFGRSPSRTREQFCRDAGLADTRPFVLYVCSALFRGSPSEAAFVARWAAHLRQAPLPRVRGAGILVRPHPQRMYEWDGAPTEALASAGVAFRGGHPIDEAGRDDYFDALYYAAAVVGLNTSAMIEAAIVDRPVLTMVLPEFSENQTGTLHFRYLLDGPDAFLHAATDMDEHVAQLDAALSGRLANRNAGFVERFIRPNGMDRAATPVFVEALESFAAEPARVADYERPSRPWRSLANAWYRSFDRPVVQAMMLEASHAVEERDRARRLDEKHARVRERNEERRARAGAKEDRYRVKRRQHRVAQLKTAVRRVLAVGGRGAGSH
jgi:hypothetical protein